MFEILTSTLLPNHVPGTMPSLSLFSYLDSTHFSGFFGISYMVVGTYMTSVTSIILDLERFYRGHGDKSMNESMKILTKSWADKE